MYPINESSLPTALNVLVKAFKENPGAQWVLKKDTKIQERLTVLCQYCLTISMLKHGAFLTSDATGVALFFENDRRIGFRTNLMGYLRLGQNCIGWSRAPKIIYREWQIVLRRPKIKHLYFWMIAVEDHSNGLNTIIELRDFAFKRSKELQRPILAETTTEENLTLYKRYGFRVYDTWNSPQKDLKVYFLRRDWNA